MIQSTPKKSARIAARKGRNSDSEFSDNESNYNNNSINLNSTDNLNFKTAKKKLKPMNQPAAIPEEQPMDLDSKIQAIPILATVNSSAASPLAVRNDDNNKFNNNFNDEEKKESKKRKAEVAEPRFQWDKELTMKMLKQLKVYVEGFGLPVGGKNGKKANETGFAAVAQAISTEENKITGEQVSRKYSNLKQDVKPVYIRLKEALPGILLAQAELIVRDDLKVVDEIEFDRTDEEIATRIKEEVNEMKKYISITISETCKINYSASMPEKYWRVKGAIRLFMRQPENIYYYECSLIMQDISKAGAKHSLPDAKEDNHEIHNREEDLQDFDREQILNQAVAKKKQKVVEDKKKELRARELQEKQLELQAQSIAATQQLAQSLTNAFKKPLGSRYSSIDAFFTAVGIQSNDTIKSIFYENGIEDLIDLASISDYSVFDCIADERIKRRIKFLLQQ